MPRTKQLAGAELLLNVAKLSYEDRYTNKKIAAELGIGPKKVKEYLDQSVKWLLSEQRRLAQLERIETPQNRLEDELRQKYQHLIAVSIVPGGPYEDEPKYKKLIQRWAGMAAVYFDELVRRAYAKSNDGFEVGMSGGETILEIMNSLPEREREGVIFYSSALVGRASRSEHKSHVDAASNATVAWARSGRLPGHCCYATVPPYYLTPAELKLPLSRRKRLIAEHLDQLAAMPPIRAHLDHDLGEFDVAFAGLGLVKTPVGSPGRANRYTGSDLLNVIGISPEELAADGAVGEIGLCYFDRDGDDPKDKWRFFLTPGHSNPELYGLRFYRQMVKDGKPVIVIAGTYKVPGILAALKGKVFNAWFTDEEAARKVLAAK